jgi:hypothetical protein
VSEDRYSRHGTAPGCATGSVLALLKREPSPEPDENGPCQTIEHSPSPQKWNHLRRHKHHDRMLPARRIGRCSSIAEDILQGRGDGGCRRDIEGAAGRTVEY